jgi:CspA family cold shock protein
MKMSVCSVAGSDGESKLNLQIDKWLAYCVRYCTPRTREFYGACLRAFEAYLSNDGNQLTTEAIEAYIDNRLAAGWSKRYVKGYGFIDMNDGGKDIFFHQSGVDCTNGMPILSEGDAVEFEMGESRRGPCATNVRKLARP